MEAALLCRTPLSGFAFQTPPTAKVGLVCAALTVGIAATAAHGVGNGEAERRDGYMPDRLYRRAISSGFSARE
jgi:hypothetical protein